MAATDQSTDQSTGPGRHRYSSILDARRAFEAGENITAAIKRSEGADSNPRHAIEIAYELQAGSYSSGAQANPDRWRAYGAAIAGHLDQVLEPGDALLDCGTGELTSFVSALNALAGPVRPVAFDMSWSRVRVGRDFAAAHLTDTVEIDSFVGDIANIALHDGSVDVAMSVHALEPNGGREDHLIRELLRVARRRLVLFEPCFERATDDARDRMRRHGYVTGLEAAIERQGGGLVTVTEFELPANPLNPTWVFVVDCEAVGAMPPNGNASSYRCPVTGTDLRVADADAHVYLSDDAGLAYPVVDGIPILRADYAILATALARQPRPADASRRP